ncbi:hypothetical protein NQ314_016253 [Rhamnusium bicolor]|uniref:ubiquitinyl hydrolase 1 n=1 Tax=Rhamnusium bicolor TaxID=1586634 RepID=A0AAV8WYY3_9CUCU|nr:hypothetical protein NQ314_016253 [Rhamnusium bicolor]
MKGLGMEDKIVPLYISDNLQALNQLVKDKTIKDLKIDKFVFLIVIVTNSLLKQIFCRLPGVVHRLLTELLQFQNDQEKCYIFGKRYLNAMERLFRLTEDKSFVDVRYGSEYKKVQNMIRRFKKLGERVYLAPTQPEPQGTGDDKPTKVKSSIFDKTYISPVDLYNALMKKENMLIVDIRPATDFCESGIATDEGHLINIPEDILVPGLSANTLGQRLKDETKEIWDRRDSFDVIVLLDWDTDDFNYSGSKLERLRICIVEWDFNRIYHQDPVVLSGGFKEFLEWYPTEVSNSNAFLSQTNSEIDELLTLDEVTYPETGSAPGNMNLKVHTVTSFGDVQARVKRDFEDMEEFSLGPGARASRSEGQLPKDFYSSQEGISPYRSLSQESLPKEYFSIESITEPLPSAIIESEPHKEIIHEKDIEEVGKDDNKAQIESAIEDDRTLLLYKARALKPKVEKDEPSDEDPRRIIIKNLIEENKDLFKKPLPPPIDRSFKPHPTQHQGMVGDGYNGIRNLRNNCYMSAMLQCLKSLPLVKSMFVTSNSYVKHIHKHPVITLHFASVMKALWEGTFKRPKSHYPQMFFEKVYELNPVYNKGNHEDTFEFFIFLFNLLSEDSSFDMPRPKIMTEREKSWYAVLQGRSSYFIDLFYYQLRNTRVCWHCQKPNYVFDSDSSLMLPVPQNKERCNLEMLLREYLRENLVADYSCSDCKHSATIVNRKAIVLDPEILIIVLKRYVSNKDGTFRKNEIDIDFPTDHLEFGNSLYKLYAIPQHTGSMTVGHYYASVLLNDTTNTWVLFNDEKVTKYNCAITNVPGIKSSCVGFFYVRQCEIKPDCDI